MRFFFCPLSDYDSVQMDLAIHGLPPNGLVFVMADVDERGHLKPVDKLPVKLEGLHSYLRDQTEQNWFQLPGRNLWQHLGGAPGRKATVCVSVDHVSHSIFSCRSMESSGGGAKYDGSAFITHTQINGKDELVGLKGRDLIQKQGDMGDGIQIIGVGRYTTLLRLAVHPNMEITSGKSVSCQ